MIKPAFLLPTPSVDTAFDSGINSSTAWAVSRTSPRASVNANANTNSLSDEEPDVSVDGVEDTDEHEQGRSARALFAFEGKPEFRELTFVEAGDELEVLREDVGEGWSLVKIARCRVERELGREGEMGLLPQTYYTASALRNFTADFAHPPGVELPSVHIRAGSKREASGSSITPRGSPKASEQALPLVPQTTGEWFPSFRRSLLGGKSFNRFSSFVTSGAEEWVLRGTSEDVHSRTSSLSGAYTVYNVTSVFDEQGSSELARPSSPIRITVHRRFSHFVVLHTALTRRLPGIALPPLPEKQYAGRFNDDFVEARRGDLERYINRVVAHPVARYAEVLTFFLGCESDSEWRKQLPYYLSLPAKGPSFFAHVYHPAFNLDAEDAAEAGERFVGHTRAVGKGVQGLRNIFGTVREARVEMSKAERLLSYSLLSLITSTPLASAPTTGIGEDEEDEEDTISTKKGHMNDAGAWCWREGCDDCLRLTKAMQKTAETLQSVADLYDDHARRTQLATHEALKNAAHPSMYYGAVIDTHKSTLSRYHEAIREGYEDEEVAARCETVLNTTMAEMGTYHDQKRVDFETITKEHLDGEIALYEQILIRLRTARRTFDAPQYDELAKSPRQPSMYERELENPRLTPAHLTQPCPHVFDSAPMRPVSVAIQEGVGMLLGGVASPTRASVFGKFW
ncbi:PX-domain-containing protein [Amylocystis lapponica]|nr:PX-domain-containing protein [Amylocystis lapponica]